MKHWKIVLSTSLIAFIVIVALVSNFEYLPVKSCVDAYDVDYDGSLRVVNRGHLMYCQTSAVAILGVTGLAIFSTVASIRRRKL